MAKSVRNPLQREKDRALTLKLALSGVDQAEIASKLGVTHQQISYDLKLIKKRWQNETMLDLTIAKAKEIAKINNLERTYWESWDELPDPALLAGILKCIDRRCKLLGLDAPVQVDANIDFTFTFDTPNGPRPKEQLEALAAAMPYTNGRVVDHD